MQDAIHRLAVFARAWIGCTCAIGRGSTGKLRILELRDERVAPSNALRPRSKGGHSSRSRTARKLLCTPAMNEMDLHDARSVRAPSPLELLVPLPRRRETAHVDLAAPPDRVWNLVRHGDLARTSLLRMFARLARLTGWSLVKHADHRLGIDDFRSSPEQPGFQVLADESTHQLTLVALARVVGLRLSSVHASSAEALIAVDEPGFIKLGWAARLSPLAGGHCRLQLELRLGATDPRAWRAARLYFACAEPCFVWAQQALLCALADELGWPGMTRRWPPVGNHLMPATAAVR
jgi:hypothetical protein